MSPEQVIRAWKDADASACIDPTDAVRMPAHPVGPIDISDRALDMAGGSVATTEYFETLGCCQGFTQAGKCDITAGYPNCTMMCLTFIWTRWDWCRGL